MKRIFLLFTLAASAALNAQSPDAVNRCGSGTYLRQLEENFPDEYASVMQAAAQSGSQDSATTVYKVNGGTIYTIPVVVHIVYKTSAQNIDDEFVFSQLDVLNEDYRRLNDDADLTPAAFAGIADDAEIEFCLAQRDPDGVLSTGITRTETDIAAWDLFTGTGSDDYADNVKFTDKGGEDAWPRADYLNIWVCNLSFGLLGYATPPGGAPLKDGVVIGYKYFGLDSPGGVYDKGRTATHEIGHWLGLNHIWGDDDFDPEPQCDGDDNMDDTPNQEDATYGDPPFPQLDDCAPVSPGIMFMNFMDYTDDGAMNMFTQDQVTRMREVLTSTRSTIPESLGCEAGGADINGILKNQLISFTVYPNPSSDEFVFGVKNFVHSEITFEVYNLLGELVDRIIIANTPDAKVVFETGTLSAGNYYVKASDGEFTLTQQIAIVR